VAADNRTKAGVDKNHIDPCFGKEKQEKFIPAVVKELALSLFSNHKKRRASLAQSCQMSRSFIHASKDMPNISLILHVC